MCVEIFPICKLRVNGWYDKKLVCTKGYKMNITFLIGNGFDIGIGLQSRFENFFPLYQQNAQKKNDIIKQLSDEIGNDYRTWSDFEVALGKYTLKFDANTKQNFVEQIKDFETEFIAYLREQEKALKISGSEGVSKVMCSALTEYYSLSNLPPESNNLIRNIYSVHNTENHTFNFVNFNYTFTVEKCLKTIQGGIVCTRRNGSVERKDKVGNVVHVHGNCDLYPIIGVNDIGQITSEELAKDERFVRYLVKPLLNKFLRQGNDTVATNLINQSTIICVYGMSLGETDKKWWELLVKWLVGNGERQLIIFDYDEQFTTSSQFDWLEKEDAIINKLIRYGTNTKIDVEGLRLRIHIAVHKNIFAMDMLRN